MITAKDIGGAFAWDSVQFSRRGNGERVSQTQRYRRGGRWGTDTERNFFIFVDRGR